MNVELLCLKCTLPFCNEQSGACLIRQHVNERARATRALRNPPKPKMHGPHRVKGRPKLPPPPKPQPAKRDIKSDIVAILAELNGAKAMDEKAEIRNDILAIVQALKASATSGV